MVYDSSSSCSTKTCLLCKKPQSHCICSSSSVQNSDETSDLRKFNFDLNNLISNLLIHKWQWHCVIAKTNFSGEGSFDKTLLRCRVSYTSSDSIVKYLNYSRGPWGLFLWDNIGDDFLDPEIALLAISKCPPPPNVERDHL